MISYHAPAEGNPYLNDLFWVIYDRLATFTQMGATFTMSSAERGVALTQEEFPGGQRVRGRRCAAAVSEGERQQLWRLARSNPTSCAQVSKRLVAYIEALLVLSPYGRPSDPRIAAIALRM